MKQFLVFFFFFLATELFSYQTLSRILGDTGWSLAGTLKLPGKEGN